MTMLLNGKTATIEDIHRAFETHNLTPVWGSSMASFYTMPELTNWVTQGLNRLGVNADRAKISFIVGADVSGRPYYGALIFWLS